MTLVRPAGAQETTLEDQVLREIQAVGKNVDELRIQLLGGSEEETEHGRLPRAEKTIGDHEVRIKRLERAYFVVGVCTGAMGMKLLGPLGGILMELLKGH